MPWIVGGDFNVVLHEDEKIGGLPVYPPEYEDFALCVNSCGLFDIGYNGSPFTWWNGRPNDQCIFKRLDRIFVNLSYQNLFPNIEVQYLIRTCSDHAPLLMSCGHEAMQFVKHFKFLNFWATHDTFTEVVRQKWVTNFIGDPFLMFKQKLKRLKSTLSQWSKLTFGDIFKQLAIREDIVRVKEILFEEEPTIQNRIVLQQAHAELKKYLSIEEQYWKQKAGLNWFAEGDRNTRCFHNHVNEFFKNQFTQESDTTFFELLNNVPSMVTTYQNSELCRYPTLEEVKKAIFALSGDSTSGPDGFTGLFYQKCWNIVGADIFMMVQDIYGGASLPKSITHTNLVLLPKKPQVQTFSDLRPISLSNFINKVISRVLHDRMEKVLPSLISPNQSGFVKGRSIFENILLTQEIITDIRMNGKPKNMVIKLDMAKAYDSVNWKYLLKVLRKMGFAEHFINMIGNLLIHNWYLVLINGQTSGFFKSSRGMKQGDPLSPTLFILSAEVLLRSLNKLFLDRNFIGFEMPKWTDPLNHLSYANDTIIFSSADLYSLHKVMEVLTKYEQISRQLINKSKCSYYMHTKEEGGLGFRSLFDLLRSLFAKLWWNFRTPKSLWSNFTWNKYCKKKIPTLVQFKDGSHVWRKILKSREEVEHEVLWQMNRGSTNVWHENWTGIGAIYHVVPPDFNINEELHEVTQLRTENGWDDQLLHHTFPEDITYHIRQEICFDDIDAKWDTPKWMPMTLGKFTMPDARWFKYNTDGAHRGNPGLSSYGFCVRDSTRDVIFAKAGQIGVSTSLVAEAKALMEGILYCFQNQLHPLITETDSLDLKKIIEGQWAVPWSISKELRKINEIKGSSMSFFSMSSGKAMQWRIFLANLVFFFAGILEFKSFYDFPAAGRSIINYDKSQIPILRIRVARNSRSVP
uniref:Reverse transcriptase domain-containing protein n=1 Tax=Nicotiana tabacum TaxID=4097 RepID=A0A1S4A3N9_TOBAC|nr:PREDICTED: uncharacterized protein LOC107793393 [Nicotiana tabacum]